jgi:hypothetical protein
LLRLADILDYDASRTSDVLFRSMKLDNPESVEDAISSSEHKKNKAGSFSIIDEKLSYAAQVDDPNIESGIREYLKWVEEELEQCRKALSNSRKWYELRIPYLKEPFFERIGYEQGDFKLTIDQERVIDLLAGENLYNDAGVFVRELLQNSIDAVLDRVRCDRRFKLEKAKIDIYTWQDDKGYYWFRIEDNGTGMDQHIIKDYFLKVGCSYYTSDEYKKTELEPENDTGFKPTSRFGIGILSCFMSDKKRNQIQVETMRYSNSEPNKVIRLFVPEMKGSYYLFEGDNCSSREISYPPVKNKDSVRTEPGTTICVRVSQLGMGGKSFRELLDKYIVFPEVKITHYDSEYGSKTYETQGEFMEMVAELHGKGDEPQEIVHPLPDHIFKKLKNTMTDWEWTEETRPELVFTYKRCDTLSDNTAGVIIEYKVRTSAKCKTEVECDGETFYPELGCSFYYDNFRYLFSISFRAIATVKDRDWFRNHRLKSHEIMKQHLKSIEFDYYIKPLELSKILKTKSEKGIWNLLTSSENLSNIVSYNGVLAYENNSDFEIFILLLRKSNYPIVDMARLNITSLPLKTLCELSILFYGKIINVITTSTNWINAPEAEYANILKCNEKWEECFRYQVEGKSLTLSELEEIVNSPKLDKNEPPELTFFPPWLFMNDIKQGELNKEILFICDFYNPQHIFSKWLIEQRENLQENAPGLYNDLLDAMQSIKIENINKILDKLKKFKVISFNISDDINLDEDDFDFEGSKWQDE